MHDCATGQSWKTGGESSFRRLLTPNLNLRRFRDDGPYFDSLTVVESGTAFGYLHRLLNTVCLNKERSDRFLGFYSRVIRHGVPAHDNFIVMFQWVPAFEYS
jgi:hypothetical protein